MLSRSLALSAYLSITVSSVALASNAPSAQPIVVALATATPTATATPRASAAPSASSGPSAAATAPDGSGSGGPSVAGSPKITPNTPDPVASRPGIAPSSPAPFTLGASITLEPLKPLRACPVTLEFIGHISAAHWPNGSKHEVVYRWVRSDGESTAPQPIAFTGSSMSLAFPPTQMTTTPLMWTLDKTYAGSVALEILEPVKLASSRANFSLHCGPPGPSTIVLPTQAPFGISTPR